MKLLYGLQSKTPRAAVSIGSPLSPNGPFHFHGPKEFDGKKKTSE